MVDVLLCGFNIRPPCRIFPLRYCLFNITGVSATASYEKQTSPWQVSNFNILVTFGDSYIGGNPVNYYAANNISASPPGPFLPETFSATSGGRTWPRHVIQYTGSTIDDRWDPHMMLHKYAVSGATCTNNITPRSVLSDTRQNV